MRNNPGKTMTIYDVPSIVKEAWPRAAVPTNIMNGFQAAGVCPFNPQVFNDDDFSPSYVTDRPAPTSEVTVTCAGDTVRPDATSEVTVTCAGDTVRPDATSEVTVTCAGDTDRPDLTPEVTVTTTGDADRYDTIVWDASAEDETSLLNSFVSPKGLSLVDVPGDGHCLLHAFLLCLQEQGINVGYSEMCERILEETHVNWHFYKQFHPEGCDILNDVNEYIRNKKYNTDAGDFILNILCNSYKVTATVYHNQHGTITAFVQNPRHSNVGDNVSLALISRGASAHYNAVLSVVRSGNIENEHRPNMMELEDIMPLPKAGSLKKTTRGKKRTTAILTDTPEKNAIEKQSKKPSKPSKRQQISKNKNVKGVEKKPTKSKRKKSQKGENDWSCIICTELYSNSRPNEPWIQCCECKGWAHEECVQLVHDVLFVCDYCQE